MELKDEEEKISDHWPAATPLDSDLQILVELPSRKCCVHWVSEILLTVSFSATVLGKRRQSGVDLDISAGEVWLQFRQTWWGDPRGKVAAVRNHSSSGQFLHINHAEVRQSLKLDYDDLCAESTCFLPNGVGICGSVLTTLAA